MGIHECGKRGDHDIITDGVAPWRYEGDSCGDEEDAIENKQASS